MFVFTMLPAEIVGKAQEIPACALLFQSRGHEKKALSLLDTHLRETLSSVSRMMSYNSEIISTKYTASRNPSSLCVNLEDPPFTILISGSRFSAHSDLNCACLRRRWTLETSPYTRQYRFVHAWDELLHPSPRGLVSRPTIPHEIMLTSLSLNSHRLYMSPYKCPPSGS